MTIGSYDHPGGGGAPSLSSIILQTAVGFETPLSGVSAGHMSFQLRSLFLYLFCHFVTQSGPVAYE